MRGRVHAAHRLLRFVRCSLFVIVVVVLLRWLIARLVRTPAPRASARRVLVGLLAMLLVAAAIGRDRARAACRARSAT